MSVGQAHLLDDVISLVRMNCIESWAWLLMITQLGLDSNDSAGVFQKMTLTYGLGDQHGLYEDMKAALA